MPETTPFKIGAIVLAAGFSRRFGSLKLASKLDADITVLEQTLNTIRSAIPHLIVVSRPEITSTLSATPHEIIHFEHADRGMGASLAFGIRNIRDWDAAMICLADMPAVQTQSYELLAAHAHPDRIVVPELQGRRANPVVFGSTFFEELAKLDGDCGGREIIERHKECVKVVQLSDKGLLQDIDTPSDLAALQKSEGYNS